MPHPCLPSARSASYSAPAPFHSASRGRTPKGSPGPRASSGRRAPSSTPAAPLPGSRVRSPPPLPARGRLGVGRERRRRAFPERVGESRAGWRGAIRSPPAPRPRRAREARAGVAIASLASELEVPGLHARVGAKAGVAGDLHLAAVHPAAVLLQEEGCPVDHVL